MKMKVEKNILKTIIAAKKIAIIGHVNPDADCFCSMAALKMGLERMGKKAELIFGPLPDHLTFLNEFINFSFDTSVDESSDLLIILDTPDEDRTSQPEIVEKFRKADAKIIQIDHHVEGTLSDCVEVSWSSTEFCAACEMVFYLLSELGVKIDKQVASLLLTGIMADTGGFQHQNTSADCFAVASKLMQFGARHEKIAKGLSSSYSVETLKLWGIALDRLNCDKKTGVASTFLTFEDAANLGLNDASFSGVVNFLNQIQGAKLVVFMAEEKSGLVRVSLRTRDEDIDVSRVAVYFGGGGHVKAAGFPLEGKIEKVNSNHAIIR